MRARAVIGANFGDEGKGLLTDYLCATQGAGAVVRFNGGAQAGHTVVTPEGKRHVFSHFGSGTLAGVPTFLSQFFVVNPIFFFKELDELTALTGAAPVVSAHPDCLVSTFVDMELNQRAEEARGAGRHGSVGLGVNETVVRSEVPILCLRMRDLWDRPRRVEAVLAEASTKWATHRSGKQIEDWEKKAEAFLRGCGGVAAIVGHGHIAHVKDPVFEGAQGLLLDQNNRRFFPHLTRSNTGMENVRVLCAQAGIAEVTAYYVSRTYLTRHGAGPLPGENPRMRFADDTNVAHPWQGELRFAPLDAQDLIKRCAADNGGRKFKLLLTHCDQLSPPTTIRATAHSHGPTRNDVAAAKLNIRKSVA